MPGKSTTPIRGTLLSQNYRKTIRGTSLLFVGRTISATLVVWLPPKRAPKTSSPIHKATANGCAFLNRNQTEAAETIQRAERSRKARREVDDRRVAFRQSGDALRDESVLFFFDMACSALSAHTRAAFAIVCVEPPTPGDGECKQPLLRGRAWKPYGEPI